MVCQPAESIGLRIASVKILSVDTREIRSRPAPKASVGRKELTAWSGVASTWMAWVLAIDARLTSNNKQARSLRIRDKVRFGLASVVFISASRKSALRRENNCAAGAKVSARNLPH